MKITGIHLCAKTTTTIAIIFYNPNRQASELESKSPKHHVRAEQILQQVAKLISTLYD